ncbi:MAG TPA: DUF805 domain-containing protein [Candidatus Baltobacteraceae bacterium]|nr:DUF805 domain-containing protein [Candidatus Baltobacteraceae bacterium]
MSWYLRVLRHYVDFGGRARRMEFWMFALINFLITVVLMIPVIFAVVAHPPNNNDTQWVVSFQNAAIPLNLYSLVVFLPSLAVQVRRLHDIGKSGWWYFIVFVPFAGALILLIFNCIDSEPGSNQWGGNPKDPQVVAAVPA